jgi:hypothetical protein
MGHWLVAERFAGLLPLETGSSANYVRHDFHQPWPETLVEVGLTDCWLVVKGSELFVDVCRAGSRCACQGSFCGPDGRRRTERRAAGAVSGTKTSAIRGGRHADETAEDRSEIALIAKAHFLADACH